jgi:hypothetical protein
MGFFKVISIESKLHLWTYKRAEQIAAIIEVFEELIEMFSCSTTPSQTQVQQQ